jgi:MFS family permease
MESKLRSNIWKIAISDVFYRFGVIGSIYILYFRYLGYTSFHIGLFEGITSITIVASDLFTGVIADRIGRKNSVLFSNIAFFILAILLGVSEWISDGFIVILIICGILNGLEFSFRSGARAALLYDTLIQMNREINYLKLSGRINAFGIISNVIGMAFGGFLFEILPSLPYWVWSGFILVSSIILITVQEPYIKNSKNKMSFWKEVKFGVKFIFQSRTLLWLVLFFLFADVFAESYWDIFSQDHLELLGATARNVGIIFAVISSVSAIVSYFIEKIEKTIGQKWMLYGIIGIQVMLFIAIAWVTQWYFLAILLLFFYINRNITWLLSDAYRNKLIPSEHRAAVLSAASFLNNGLFGGGLIILGVGWLIEKLGDVSILFTVLAVFILIINGSLLIVRERQKWRKLSGGSID